MSSVKLHLVWGEKLPFGPLRQFLTKTWHRSFPVFVCVSSWCITRAAKSLLVNSGSHDLVFAIRGTMDSRFASP